MIAWGKLLSGIFISIGMFFLIQVSLPLLNFELIQQKFLSAENNSLISPQKHKYAAVLGVSIQTDDQFPAIVSDLIRDSKPDYNHFFLSVPNLNMNEEEVMLDSNDLNQGLAHLPGSGLPGEKGNVFVSGHSALPVSMNLASFFGKGIKPIFSSLITMKKGDQIYVRAGGTKYTYQVISTKLVKPSDTSVIYPPDPSGRFITLMTCVPPGLNTSRWIVLGKLI